MTPRPPNPRLQRTPSRAPLSRQSLGRVIGTVLFVLVPLGCDSRSDWKGVNVSGMEDWRGATVSIDGMVVGQLEYPIVHNTAFEKALKLRGDSPVFHYVSLNVPFDTRRMKVGKHHVAIVMAGRDTSFVDISYPDPRGGDVTFIWVSAKGLKDITTSEHSS